MKLHWQCHIWFWCRMGIIRVRRKDETKVFVAAFCEEKYQDQVVSKQPGRDFLS